MGVTEPPEGKGIFYFSFLGRPLGRMEDSSPRILADFTCKVGAPNGVPLCRLCRKALSSTLSRAVFTRRVHYGGFGTGHAESRPAGSTATFGLGLVHFQSWPRAIKFARKGFRSMFRSTVR